MLVTASLVFTLSGCLPVLVGGLIYKSSKTREQKQEFISTFRQTNADREARGLDPLDWCEEVVRFDRGWAYEDVECRPRLAGLEETPKP